MAMPSKHDFNVGDIVRLLDLHATAIITEILEEDCHFPIVVRRFSAPDSDCNVAPNEPINIS